MSARKLLLALRPHSVDYRERDGSERGLVNRGFWLSTVPRPLLACRLAGHRPVVDGTKGWHNDPGARWVCCDRCGVRPDPQGVLDPASWDIGQPYTGGLTRFPGRVFIAPAGTAPPTTLPPGPWPTRPTGVLGGQLVLGGAHTGVSAGVKVGSSGSEHTLAAHVHLGRAAALYLHTERFGTWLQRQLNPTGYDSRVVGASVHGGRLHWELWARRHDWSSDDPKWMQGSVLVDPVERLLGPARYSYEDVGDPVDGWLRMPHGDDHQVVLQLRRESYGRARGRQRLSWSVSWRIPDGQPGIPTKLHNGGRVSASAVKVGHIGATEGGWPAEAVGAIAARLTADRVSRGWPAPTPESLLQAAYAASPARWSTGPGDDEVDPASIGPGRIERCTEPCPERAANAEFGTDPEDHPVTCSTCQQRVPAALIADHLVQAHGTAPTAIADAPVVDKAGEDGPE